MLRSIAIEGYRALFKFIGIFAYGFYYKGLRDLVYEDYNLVHVYVGHEMCLVPIHLKTYSAIPWHWNQDEPQLNFRPRKKYKHELTFFFNKET